MFLEKHGYRHFARRGLFAGGRDEVVARLYQPMGPILAQ